MLSSVKHYSFIWILFIFIGCSGGGSGDEPITPPEPNVITPSNLTLTIEIIGANTQNPNGDGSGKIKCIATAKDAVNFGYRFGTGSEINSTTGTIDYNYSSKGSNQYTIYVVAYSKTGHSITLSKEITVYVQENIIFSDEFSVDGNPDNTKWSFDIGTGTNGWGNQESQFYTSRTDNVKIEGGFLKITAKKENYSGSNYTSARLKTQGKFDFTYGKVEVRAKLPTGVGTWPAIWMLGSKITTIGWPKCGEIDIMEHVGKRVNWVSSALHTVSSSGNTINYAEKYVSDATTAFHIYAAEWNSEKIIFSIDGVPYYTYNPATKNSDTWPFTDPQFIILNVALGGNLGGSIDPNFSSATMEIDYVRVYQ